MLSYNKKESLSVNADLKETHFYDRRLFYLFLCQTRVRNPDSCVWWDIVTAAASYSHGSTRNYQNQIGMYLGSSCSIQMFLNKTKPYVTDMSASIRKLLKDELVIVAALDNNQKGYSLNFQ